MSCLVEYQPEYIGLAGPESQNTPQELLIISSKLGKEGGFIMQLQKHR